MSECKAVEFQVWWSKISFLDEYQKQKAAA
jgi:hypothetical protein